jgi:hypothetical protein
MIPESKKKKMNPLLMKVVVINVGGANKFKVKE